MRIQEVLECKPHKFTVFSACHDRLANSRTNPATRKCDHFLCKGVAQDDFSNVSFKANKK